VKIRHKYSRLLQNPELESLVFGLIEPIVIRSSIMNPEINVNFESGIHGNRVRIRATFETKEVVRVSASADSD